jgi:hypothetical protein
MDNDGDFSMFNNNIFESESKYSATDTLYKPNTYNYPNDPIQKIGLRDKADMSSGLQQVNPHNAQISTFEHTIIADTRDCVGSKSLVDAQQNAIANGIRPGANGLIANVTGYGLPIVVTFADITNLRDGDNITIRGVQGNTSANGKVSISNLTATTSPEGTASIHGFGNGNYTGSGEWSRDEDPGYPILKNTDSFITENQMIINLPIPLKSVRSLCIYDIVIPRDIIPLNIYIQDFISVSTTYVDIDYDVTQTIYTTFIPEEPIYTLSRIIGFYSSPLDLFRAYVNGSMSMPDQVTTSPLELWNPPLGSWPNGQPVSYPYQTVPTYKTNDFTVSGSTETYYLILSGYGVYDFIDWTTPPGSDSIADAIQTSIMRKLLLLLIVPKQSYKEIDYVTLILGSNTVTPGNYEYPFGYGDYQRMVCGPGYLQKYNPGTNISFPGNPCIPTEDSPIAFPNFRGNVCGPYNSPGDRFQKFGVISTIQDLYLNGDLNNLFGDSIILPNVPTEGIPFHGTYGLNFLSLIEVSLGNFFNTTNLNILNAMRITPNGFGANNIRANGSGILYENVFNPLNEIETGAGGIGPSNMGPPNSWVNHGLLEKPGIYSDPIAKGPNSGEIGPDNADARYPGRGIIEIPYRVAYYDLGPESGSFISKITKYVDYATSDIPDSDLIIKIEETGSSFRQQSTNSSNGPSVMDCPIRLNVGSTSGTQQYIESLQSKISIATGYWEKRMMVPIGRLEKMHLTFFSYDGIPIPLELMLQERRSLALSRLTAVVVNTLNLTDKNPFNVTYLFDPMDPRLIGRVKRNFQIIFKATVYEGVAPGMNVTSYAAIPPEPDADSEVVPYS